MENATILLIAKDANVLELLKHYLSQDGCTVHACSEGDIGLQLAIRLDPDLIILDGLLPDMEGLRAAQLLRAHPSVTDTPLIMISARKDETDMLAAYAAGVDDFVTKPFKAKILLARVRAILRRMRPPEVLLPAGPRDVGPLTLDPERHEVLVRGEPMPLTLAEFRLLTTLVSRPGKVFTREQLLDRIANGDDEITDRNVDVHIKMIRRKLGPERDFILTVRGVGYKCRV